MGHWTVVLGICFRTFFKKWCQEGVRKSTRRKLTDCIAVLLASLIMRHRLLERFLKDHRCLEPYFHQNVLVFWITYPIQFLRIVTFLSNCTSCNSYSLIAFQNYSGVLAVLTQGFPLIRSNVCQSSFVLAIFSVSFSSRYCFFFCLIVLWTSFLAFVDFPVYVETAWLEFFK